jgi:hypothetical protein
MVPFLCLVKDCSKQEYQQVEAVHTAVGLLRGVTAGSGDVNGLLGRSFPRFVTLLRLVVEATQGGTSMLLMPEITPGANFPSGSVPAALPVPRGEALDALLVKARELAVDQLGFRSQGGNLLEWAANAQAAVALFEERTSSCSTGHDTLRPLLISKLILQLPPIRESIGIQVEVGRFLLGLQELSRQVLGALPLAHLCCTNPGCGNVAGLSACSIVFERGLCGGCKAARYCSKACQQQDWEAHRAVCKALRGMRS